MDSASFVSKADSRTKLGEAVRMMLVKDKFVVENGLPSLLAASRRAFFINRRPTILSAVTRRGTKEDAELGFEITGVFATYDNDAAIAVGKKGEIALLEVKTSTDGQTTVAKTVAETPAAAEVVAATFLTNSLDFVALLANGAVIKYAADLQSTVELRKECAFKGTYISALDDYVLVPSKDGIDIISIATKKSALPSAFVPHSQGEVIAAHIFRKWKPTGASNVVMTVGADGREVRLWTGLGNGAVQLAAHLAVDIPKEAVKKVVVADQEENVLITFGSTVVVLTTDVNKVRFARATEYEQEGFGSFCAYNETSKTGAYQLVMVTRTSDAVLSVKLPPSINGEANLSADAASSAAAAPKAEANYFANARAKDASSAVVVSSSLSPAAAVDSSVAEKAAAAAIAAVSADTARKVGDVTVVAAGAQKSIATFVGTLQSQSTQANAAKQGKEHATRNASRFTTAAAPAAAAAAAPAAGENAQQLTMICDHIKAAIVNATNARTETVVLPKAKAAVDAIGGEADVADLPLPKLTSVPQMQTFNANIDKALKGQNDYLKAEADTRASTYNAQVVRSGTTTRQTIAESKKFLADLKSELAGLTKDVDAVKVELATSSTRQIAGGAAVSSANVVEDSVALVEKKQFEQAVQKITQANNFQLLLEFIGHPVVKAASDAGAFVPGTISAPAFGMLVQQLAADIEVSKGHIAPRVSWLYTLAMDWDDYIDETVEGSDAKAKALLNTLAPAMYGARRSVEGLSSIKDDVSIESRRQARTITRVLAKFE